MVKSMRISNDRTNLILNISDNEQHVLSAAYLRQHARRFTNNSQRQKDAYHMSSKVLTITTIEAKGPKSVNIQFSDGYNEAIYPFHYLVQLSKSRNYQ